MSKRMTAERLQEIQDRANAASPGEWRTDGYGNMIWAKNPYGKGEMQVADIRGWGHLTGRGCGACGMEDESAAAIQDANGEFIAHARTDIPDLLEEIKRLMREVGDLK